MNVCIISGNLGDDPQSFFSQEGEQVVSFPMAFNSGKDKTSWIKVTCFRKLAEICEKHLHKGARVAVTGGLNQNKWKTDEGENRTSYQLIARSVEFIKIDGRGFENKEPSENGDVPF